MDITVNELKEKMDRGEEVVLIDVRQPDEHEAFNVGGQLIPLQSLPHRLEEIKQHRDDEVVVYCRSGARSGNAQRFLRQQGFKNVRNLQGGMLAWQETFGE